MDELKYDDAAIEPWAVPLLPTNQAAADARYAEALKAWKLACDTWLNQNTRNREMGLPITPFIATPPQHNTVHWSPQDRWFVLIPDPVDPALKPPVLPPFSPTPVHPADQLGTGAPAQSDMLAKMAKQVEAVYKVFYPAG